MNKFPRIFLFCILFSYILSSLFFELEFIFGVKEEMKKEYGPLGIDEIDIYV